jgi:hypothetical protein
MTSALSSRVDSSLNSDSVVTICCNVRNADLYNRRHYARHLPGSEDMMELIRLYTQIALLRRGPQDVPASTVLLVATIAAYFVVNLFLSTVLPPPSGPWLQILIADVLFTMAWYALLLRLMNKAERFLQTTTAVFGYQAILSPLSIAAGWLIGQFRENTLWQLPVGLLFVLVFAWSVAANSQVLKSALEWSMPACVALVILQFFAAQVLFYSLFPELRA